MYEATTVVRKKQTNTKMINRDIRFFRTLNKLGQKALVPKRFLKFVTFFLNQPTDLKKNTTHQS